LNQDGKTRLGLLAGGLLMICACLSHAQIADTSKTPPDSIRTSIDLVVLPFANFTGHADAIGVVMPRIYHHLQAEDISFIADTEMRQILRNHRIRSVGRIGRQGAEIIQTQTGAAYLMLGSLDIFRQEGVPELGISIRILDLTSMSVIKAASFAATSEDYAGLFGIGRPGTGIELADRVMADLFKQLGDPLLAAPQTDGISGSCQRIALVPFENRSDLAYAGDIFSNILLSELVSAGYLVVENGFVNEIFLKRQVVSRGQINLATLEEMHAQLQTCMVLTGVVDIFKPALGDISEAAPDLEIGVRALDAATGKLLMTYDQEKSGHDSESLLRLGRTYSLGGLAQATARHLVSQIERKRNKIYPEVN